MKLDTPMGEYELPDTYADEYKGKTDIELLEILIEQNKKYVDPVLVQLLVDKGLLCKGEMVIDIENKIKRMKGESMQELKEFAKKLTEQCSYRNIPQELVEEAKSKGIVIVSGASDDLMEFDGAIYDEIGCYEGGTCYLRSDGTIFENIGGWCSAEIEICNRKSIKAIWCDKDSEWTWTYKTEIPHETFEMMDDGEKYCLGLVFYKKALEE